MQAYEKRYLTCLDMAFIHCQSEYAITYVQELVSFIYNNLLMQRIYFEDMLVSRDSNWNTL